MLSVKGQSLKDRSIQDVLRGVRLTETEERWVPGAPGKWGGEACGFNGSESVYIYEFVNRQW